MEGLVAIIGPTAVGKSDLAFQIAQDFEGEIVSADSRQVYRYMNIGTAKPSLEQRDVIPHYLIDMVNPDEVFSLALYQKSAYEAIGNIQSREKLPLLVGGSGLYVWAVIEGWKIPEVPPNHEFRCSLEDRAKKEGYYVLYEELQKVDPVAALKITPTNLRRVIRALEIYKVTGYPPSQIWRKEMPPFPVFIVGLTTNREDLYQRIDLRVDKMIKDGLVEETQDLLSMGYSLNLPAMSGIGYKQIGMFLQGKLDLPSAVQQIKYETHRFARHQFAWFHLQDKRICWLEISKKTKDKVRETVKHFIGNLNKEIKG